MAVASLSLLAVLSLTGCGSTLVEVADAKAQCHELGGKFEAYWVEEYGTYFHSCDLSDDK
jgi:hypothetical protein